MAIMHTSGNDVGPALDILKIFWSGPIGVYPESGYFKSPDWQFVNVIEPDALVTASKEWQAEGASAFGGCCGIGADHIIALREPFR